MQSLTLQMMSSVSFGRTGLIEGTLVDVPPFHESLLYENTIPDDIDLMGRFLEDVRSAMTKLSPEAHENPVGRSMPNVPTPSSESGPVKLVRSTLHLPHHCLLQLVLAPDESRLISFWCM